MTSSALCNSYIDFFSFRSTVLPIERYLNSCLTNHILAIICPSQRHAQHLCLHVQGPVYYPLPHYPYPSPYIESGLCNFPSLQHVPVYPSRILFLNLGPRAILGRSLPAPWDLRRSAIL